MFVTVQRAGGQPVDSPFRDAVRNYLVANHQLDSTGWFATRKVAAVGFGAETPLTLAGTNGGQPPPPRRVEIVLFTPQT